MHRLTSRQWFLLATPLMRGRLPNPSFQAVPHRDILLLTYLHSRPCPPGTLIAAQLCVHDHAHAGIRPGISSFLGDAGEPDAPYLCATHALTYFHACAGVCPGVPGFLGDAGELDAELRPLVRGRGSCKRCRGGCCSCCCGIISRCRCHSRGRHRCFCC